MRRELAEWFKWRLVALAERLVWRYGYGVYHRAYVDAAYTKVDKLHGYAGKSGHLTRGFHAGKRVQRDTADVAELLYAARRLAVPRGGPVHIGEVVGMVLGGLLARALVHGGARSW